MKKVLKIASMVCLLGLLQGNWTTAQAQKGFELGGGLFFATDEVFSVGLDVRGVYQFNENWRGAVTLGLFAPQKEEIVFFNNKTTFTYSAFAFNIDANYVFKLNSDKIKPYVLAGLNFVTVSAKVENSGVVTNAEAEGAESGVSFNFGGGVDFKLNKITPFGELRYSAGEANYGVLVAGIKFKL